MHNLSNAKLVVLIGVVLLMITCFDTGCGGGGGGGGSTGGGSVTTPPDTTKTIEINGSVSSASPGLRSFAPNVTTTNSIIEITDDVNGTSISGAGAEINNLNSFKITIPLNSLNYYLFVSIKDKESGKTKYKNFVGRIPTVNETNSTKTTVYGVVISEESTARALIMLEDKSKIPDQVIATSDTNILSGQKSQVDTAVDSRITNASTKLSELKKAISAVSSIIESSSVDSTTKSKILSVDSLNSLITGFVEIAKEYSANNTAVKAIVGGTAPAITLGATTINANTTTNTISTIIAAVKSEITAPQVLSPVLSPAAGTYTTAQSVTITCATSGATIKYTTDGSTPSATNGTVYTAAIAVSTTTTIKAIATRSGMTDSSIIVGVFEIKPSVATPVFSPVAGTYIEAQSVTITCATSGAVIKYTTDGSEPSSSSPTYTSAISVSATTTIKAIATKNGMTDSSIVSGIYEIKPRVATPVISPITDEVLSTPQSITITCSTVGATIRYTTDGSMPSDINGSIYSTPFQIFQIKTIKAIAYKSGMTNSTIANANYTFDNWKIVNLNNETTMTFRWIEPGNFMMGSTTNGGYTDRQDELPQHNVTITKGFWIADSECTQAQWYAVIGNYPSYNNKIDPYFDTNLLRPVENISWNDCQNFMTTMNNKNLGIGIFRLPTEAEWEYSCRAGTTTPYYTGYDIDHYDLVEIDKHDWYYSIFDDYHYTNQIRKKLENPWGLYDMGGNVREWCNDWYYSQYYTTSTTTNPTGPVSGSERVVRGSSAWLGRSDGRPANRDRADPSYKSKDIGFRVIIEF